MTKLKENPPCIEEQQLQQKMLLRVKVCSEIVMMFTWSQTQINASILRGLTHAAQRSLSNLWAPVSISSPRPLRLWGAHYKGCFMLPGCVALRGNGH